MSTTADTPTPRTVPENEQIRKPAIPAGLKVQFGADAIAKKEFFEALTEFVKKFGGLYIEHAALNFKDEKETIARAKEFNKYDNYEYRYNKKFTVTVLFRPSDKTPVKPHYQLQFKGRKSDNPEILVFECTAPAPEEGAETIPPCTIEVAEHLVRDWLRYGMIK
jgi:hypothetical protein